MPSFIKTATALLPLFTSHVSAWNMTFNTVLNCAIPDETARWYEGEPGTTFPDEDSILNVELITPGLWRTITAEAWDDGCVIDFWHDRPATSGDKTPTFTLEKDNDRYVHDTVDGKLCLAEIPGAYPGGDDSLRYWKYNCS